VQNAHHEKSRNKGYEHVFTLVRSFTVTADSVDDIPQFIPWHFEEMVGRALITAEDKPPMCLRCRRTGHVRKNCEEPYCNLCRSFGHDRSDCDKEAWTQVKMADSSPPQFFASNVSTTGVTSAASTLIVSEAITVNDVNAPMSKTPSTATDVPSSPAYALDSPVFSGSVISSPTKLHSKASLVEKTLLQAADKLAGQADGDITVISEGETLIGNASEHAKSKINETEHPSATVILPVNATEDSQESVGATAKSPSAIKL
jgi:hypothetical protein